MARGNKLLGSDIRDVDEAKGVVFEVLKSSGSKHQVSFGNDNLDSVPSYTCQDWTNWNIPCKHSFAIFKHRPSWQWDKLPPAYLQGPYLSTDADALTNHLMPHQSP